MFIGRKNELKLLKQLKKKKTSSMVCILGRRRIGKSRLINEFAKEFESFIEIQGLGPDKKVTNSEQLVHFSNKIAAHFKTAPEIFSDWEVALNSLAQKTSRGEHLILLDEISWMGGSDPLFAVKLKDAWDTMLKKNPQLILVICGSVSSWIEDHILNNTSFVGRVSLAINLQELSLPEINQFWKKQNSIMSSFEKVVILSVTGGVPKYLEEILETETAQENLLRLCFQKNGILFNEFNSIFNDVFQRRAATFEKIIKACLIKKLSPQEMAFKLKKTLSSEISKDIHILELSGFLSRDYYFKPNGEISKFSHLRVKDNYLRFYFKVLEKEKLKIEKGGIRIKSLTQLPSFHSIMGLQFENLILSNRELLYPLLNLEQSEIVSSAPYVQKKNSKNSSGCQIDLLIQNSLDVFFICEFKCKKEIDRSIINDVQKKVNAITLPRRCSVRTVLVYEGEIYPNHREVLEKYFYRLISFSELLVE